MNTETSESPFPTSTGTSTGSGNLNGSDGTVRRVAQAAHEAVDRLEQTLGSSSERVMGLQQEYSEVAREQVRANPLMAVGAAFAVGVIFSKLFMR
ncbi:MAG TPA: hypothetical protein VEA35_15870 [Ramlibacter sp.]|nr:hypothetical protein [Ramlibacter sp.]